MFSCFTCGAEAFTIRGCCAVCDPAAHQQHREMADAYDKARLEYLRDTGREPLSDYDAFEKWARARLNPHL